MKKLFILDSVFLFLLFSIFILGYYFFQYPDDFNIIRYLRDAEWKTFVFIIAAIFAVAILLSFIPLKKFTFAKKILVFLACLQVLFLSFLLFELIAAYIKNQKDFEGLVLQYRKKADTDMKSGLIVIDYAGGLEIIPSEKEQRMNGAIDSIRKSFGVTYRNSGCIISPAIIKAQEEYVKYTKPYLDKRNGFGWEARMKQKIEEIRNDFR